MNKYLLIPVILCLVLLTFSASAGVPTSQNSVLKELPSKNIDYLDEVLNLIEKHFFDKNYRGFDLQELRKKYKKQVQSAKSKLELHKVVNEMLAEFKVSHLAIMEEEIYKGIKNERTNSTSPEFGFKLRKLDSKYFATRFSEGGAADKSELKYGDEIISVNGKPVEACDILIDNGNDVGIPGPEYYIIKADLDETVKLEIRRDKDSKSKQISIKAVEYNETKSTDNSIKIIEKEGKKFAYIHTWHFLTRRIFELFSDAIEDEFVNCDAMILDVRGHGGSAMVIQMFLAVFSDKPRFRNRVPNWNKPLVVLIDEGSRSAKEIFAYEIQRDKLGSLIGRRTQGAVLGSNFYKLSDESALIMPVVDGSRYTRDGKTLEGNGVEPDIVVPLQLQYADGKDEILERGIKEALKLTTQEEDPKEDSPNETEENIEEDF